MKKALVTGLLSYVVTTFLGYVAHWAIHQRWTGPAYRAHRAHHVLLYPPGRLVSDSYLDAGKDSTAHTFLLAFAPLLAAPLVLCYLGVITVTQALAIIAGMGIVGVLDDSIHDSFHVKDHWLGRIVPGYEEKRDLHFEHHTNMKKNFGIYGHVWDKVFGTFKLA